MLTILSELVDALIKHAYRDHPIEACGIIAGAAGSDRPMRWIAMRNAIQSCDFFQFDTQQQLQVWKEMAARGEEPVVIYHSHTQSRAYPSCTDIAYAGEPQAHYVIISTNTVHGQAFRSFRIAEGKVIEETINIVKRYASTDTAPVFLNRETSP